jgi:hypothetical protein
MFGVPVMSWLQTSKYDILTNDTTMPRQSPAPPDELGLLTVGGLPAHFPQRP